MTLINCEMSDSQSSFPLLKLPLELRSHVAKSIENGNDLCNFWMILPQYEEIVAESVFRDGYAQISPNLLDQYPEFWRLLASPNNETIDWTRLVVVEDGLAWCTRNYHVRSQRIWPHLEGLSLSKPPHWILPSLAERRLQQLRLDFSETLTSQPTNSGRMIKCHATIDYRTIQFALLNPSLRHLQIENLHNYVNRSHWAQALSQVSGASYSLKELRISMVFLNGYHQIVPPRDTSLPGEIKSPVMMACQLLLRAAALESLVLELDPPNPGDTNILVQRFLPHYGSLKHLAIILHRHCTTDQSNFYRINFSRFVVLETLAVSSIFLKPNPHLISEIQQDEADAENTTSDPEEEAHQPEPLYLPPSLQELQIQGISSVSNTATALWGLLADLEFSVLPNLKTLIYCPYAADLDATAEMNLRIAFKQKCSIELVVTEPQPKFRNTPLGECMRIWPEARQVGEEKGCE